MLGKVGLFFFIFSIGIYPLYGQLIEDFSDGDLENNVFWNGDTANFRVNEEQMLQLNAPEAGTSFIYANTNIGLNQTWEIYAKLDFAPSNSNFSKIYLALNDTDLNQASGYFLRLGESNAEDAIELYQLTNGDEILMARATNGAIAIQPAEARIRLSLLDNIWRLDVDYSTGTNFNTELTLDQAIAVEAYQYFGIYCKYTTTRTEDFFYDDIFIPDEAEPVITDFEISDAQTVLLCMSEEILDVELSQVSITPAINVSGISKSGAEDQKFLLDLESEIISGTVYTVCLNDISDFSGNTNQSTCIDISFIEDPKPGELIVNEILADPFSGEEDFVEIFNTTDKILSLEHVQLANLDKDEMVSLESQTITAGAYMVFTESTNSLVDNYIVLFPENIIEQSIPSYNISDGNVSLIFDDGIDNMILDSFDYKDDFHFELLDITKGVSLERLDSSSETNNPQNWHSCSQIAGFATPGYTNSQAIAFNPITEKFALNDHIFSPNGDGDQDLLIINYSFEKPGYLVDLNIYDESGYLVKNLERSLLPSTEGFVQWNGIDDEGNLSNLGVYILHISGFHPDGDVMNEKLLFILADFF